MSNDNDVNVSLLFTHFDLLSVSEYDLDNDTAIVRSQEPDRVVEESRE